MKIFFFLLIVFNCFSQEDFISADSVQKTDSASDVSVSGDGNNSGGKVIYEYKKEDYFNFEALNVKGELLSPGDLSSKATKRAKYSPSKYIRKNFDDYIVNDLLEIY